MYLTQMMRNIFKRSKERGFMGTCCSFLQIVYVPLTFLRDITIPMSDEDAWTRWRAAVLPSTQLLAFFYLFGMLNDLDSDDDDEKEASMTYLIAGLVWMGCGLIAGIFIYLKTKPT